MAVCLELSYHIQYNPTGRHFAVDKIEIREVWVCASSGLEVKACGSSRKGSDLESEVRVRKVL